MNKKMRYYGKQSSIIRTLFEYGNKRKKEIGEDNVFDFSIGNPNVSCPEIVSKTLISLINHENPVTLHSYSSAIGYTDSREAIVNYLNQTYQVSLSSKYIYLTSGASSAIVIALNAILNKNDEVIVFTPFFPEYKIFVNKAGGKLISVQTTNQFYPDFDDFKKRINKRTKMVIINTPNNPTGVVYPQEVICQLASILNEAQNKYHHSIYLLSDEPYREIIYDNVSFPFITNFYKNSMIAYSFSKSLSLPGERIGYLLLNNQCKRVNDVFASICGAARAMGYVCESTLFQKMVPYCLGNFADLSIYKENRDYLYQQLVNIGYELIYPKGAFYLFMKALEEDAIAFMEVAKKYELLIVPSDSFGIKSYVRISYCVSFEQIKKAIPAFKKLYQHYKGE